MTPYLEYHPGGITELMRGIGRDATDLFDEVGKKITVHNVYSILCIHNNYFIYNRLLKTFTFWLPWPSLDPSLTVNTVNSLLNMDTSISSMDNFIRRTPGAGPCHFSVICFKITVTRHLSKTDSWSWSQQHPS